MRRETFTSMEDWVKELLNPSLPFNPQDGRVVPTKEHSHLTVHAKSDLRAVRIDACVMHIDLRDSTRFNTIFGAEVTSKVYTAFIRMVLQAAQHHDGSVRNIIGDRVMIVFVGNDCFQNALDCAVTCNTMLKSLQPSFVHLLGTRFNVKAGIGIDFGTMNVVWVGITRVGREAEDNQNLVWLGQAANIASKLTDKAGKKQNKFAYLAGKMTPTEEEYLPILITERVYNGIQAIQPICPTISKNLWHKSSLTIDGRSIPVYGGDIWWGWS